MSNPHPQENSEAPNAWNDEEVARLRDLAAQNLPASVMGRQLRRSRNAIIGKLHRMGIHIRPSLRPNRSENFWNADNLRKLRRYYHSPLGYSYPEIAYEMNCGLPTLKRGIARMRAEDGIRTPKANRGEFRAGDDPRRGPKIKPDRIIAAPAPVAEDLSMAVMIGGLDQRPGGKSCRWPVQGHGWDMLYCGRLAMDGRAYCREHTRRAYAR